MRMFPVPFASLALLCVGAPATAATLGVDVRGADGKPLAGAVVVIETPRKSAGPIHFAWSNVMAQRNIAFDPHVLIVPVGSSVSFPNQDKVRHHVYSVSKTKKFDLKLYGRDETRSVVFDKPGVVAIGCNIHDAMSGVIVVVDSPFAAQTDANGHAVFTGVPAGTATARLWHPAIRAPDNSVTQSLSAANGGTITLNAGRR
jgi:plastocyanin